MTSPYPPEVQAFINAHPEFQVLDYERYENIIQVKYMADMADGSRRIRNAYIRVSKERQMSDSDISKG